MNMTKISALVLTIFLVGLAASASAPADGPVRLSVRIFQIPAEQSFEVRRPDGNGGAFTLRVSGNVAGRFPRGTVFVPTELAWNASESTIGAELGRSVAFGCGDLPADHLEVRELKALDLRLDAGHPSEAARFEENRREGRTDNYEIRIERLSGEAGGLLLRLRLFAGWSARAGSLGVGMSSDVISTVAEVPEGKLLLIGAPGEKAVYVLAVCAERR